MSTDRVGGSGIVRRHKSSHAVGGSDALTPADIGAAAVGDVVPNSIVNAKGDLVTATANDTPAIQSVGANGEVLYADSSATNGLRWQGVYNAGRNRIINSDFSVWQRGTSITNAGGATVYTCDRWFSFLDGNGSATISRQSFTPGTAPTSGYEGQYFARWAVSSLGSSTVAQFGQRIESSRTFAGQTVTFSCWMKADSARDVTVFVSQIFGSGGSSGVTTGFPAFSVGTSWARYTATVTIPSVSGKTIGVGDYLQVFFQYFVASGLTLDIWGVQIESGNVATRYEERTRDDTLRQCQRFYQKSYEPDTAPGTVNAGDGSVLYDNIGGGTRVMIYLPTAMRAVPSVTFYNPVSGASGSTRNLDASTNTNTAAAAYIGSKSFGFDSGVLAPGATGIVHYVASAEL